MKPMTLSGAAKKEAALKAKARNEKIFKAVYQLGMSEESQAEEYGMDVRAVKLALSVHRNALVRAREKAKSSDTSKAVDRIQAFVPVLERPIEALNLSEKSSSALVKTGIFQTIGDIVKVTRRFLARLPRVGALVLLEVEARLAQLGLSLAG